MNRSRFTDLPAALGLILTIGAVAAFGSPAAAASPFESVVAHISSGPFHIDVAAVRPADSPATSASGVFDAHGTLGSTTFTRLHGPVTCLDVRGDRAGLFYPITSSDPPLFAKLHSGVFIYLQLNKRGKPITLGFLPVPIASTKSCAPQAALMPVTSGTATLVP